MLPPREYPEETLRLSSKTLQDNRVAVFVVCYNAERHINDVLERIPDSVVDQLAEVFVIDDNSSDKTVSEAASANWNKSETPLKIFRTPYNQGYGGNQRLGYLYAIAQKFDIVVLLHGDGQYAPEYLPDILAEYSRQENVAAVFGSRFLIRGGARHGGMPLYKLLGNRVLTWTQNRILGTTLSEMHSGYRSYRTAALQKIPFQHNSLGFDFDADIIIQFAEANLLICEVPIPTYYGDEICHVNGLGYAWACLKTASQYRLMQGEIFYTPKFDLPTRPRKYTVKASPTSLHYHIRHLSLPPESNLLDLGGGDGGAVAVAHAELGINTTVVDMVTAIDDDDGRRAAARDNLQQISADIEGDWPNPLGDQRFDTVFVLDVLEHMKSPERTANQIFSVMKPGAKLYASTGNIAFWVIRFMVLMGQFNYGRRGILDLTHTRLFTIRSFKTLLRDAGFRIDTVRCFGPPIADLDAGGSSALGLLDRFSSWLARTWGGLFGYQILIEATRPDSIETLMENTFVNRRNESNEPTQRHPDS